MNSNDNEENVDRSGSTEEESSEQDVPLPPPPRRGKFYYVEPVIFLLLLPGSMFETVVTNTIELQYCKAVLHEFDNEACLNTTAAQFTEIQQYATQFAMARSCIEMILPAFLSFFVGPWSDTFGRKPLMMSASIGFFISSACWSWGISSRTLHPDYFLLFSVPIALSGGPVLMIMATFCYICDVTTLENRAARMGMLTAILYAGSLIGSNLAPYLVLIDYVIPFALSAGLTYICIMYIYFLLAESVSVPELQRRATSKNPFQIKQLRSLYETVYVKQSAQTFLTIVLIIVLISISLIQNVGESAVFYLFLQRVLGWTLIDYNPLNSTSIILTAICSYAGTRIFSQYLKLPDLLSLSIALFMRLLSSLTLMFAYKLWHVYVSKILNGLLGVFGALIRLHLSKIIAGEDLGKVFAFIGSLESFTPLVGSLAYNSVFYATVETYPRAIFFLSGILSALLMIVIAIIVHVSFRRTDKSLIVPQTSSVNA